MTFFWVAKFSNSFFGVLEIPDIFVGEGQMLGPSLRMKKKMRVPHVGMEVRWCTVGRVRVAKKDA